MRIPPQLTLADVQSAFRDLNERLDILLSAQNIDLGQRRIINAGDGVNDRDYVTKRQLAASSVGGTAPLTVDAATIRKILTVLGAIKLRLAGLTSPGPGVIAVVKGDGTTLGTLQAALVTAPEVDSKKFALDASVIHTYTPTAVSALRTGDFSALSTADVRSILGTLITDLQAAGLLG